jgi:hypothetical protein
MTDAREGAVEGVAKPLQGHWDNPDPDMVAEYSKRERSSLMHGDMTDFALANRQYMAGRGDLDLVAWQTAAKERIRWLSVQLAENRAAMPVAPDQENMADLLTKAVGDIFAALTLAGKADKFSAWTKPYVDALNGHDEKSEALASLTAASEGEAVAWLHGDTLLPKLFFDREDAVKWGRPNGYHDDPRPLYVHPAPSDQEKLVGEAIGHLRKTLQVADAFFQKARAGSEDEAWSQSIVKDAAKFIAKVERA